VNAIAREDDVDKVLIYRYFKNLDGLLKKFLEERDYWIKTESSSKFDLESKETDILRKRLKDILTGQLRELKNNEEMQEFMR
jgi:hypothetical protein